MILDDVVGMEVDDAFPGDESHWFERVPPELEWDESEAAFLVQGIVGESQMRAHT